MTLRPAYINAAKDPSCRQAIYVPALTQLPSGHVQPPTDYLLLVFDNHLLISKMGKGDNLQSVKIPLDDVICIEMGEALLFSWMKIVFGKSECHEIEMPFNTVRADLFKSTLKGLRRSLDQTCLTSTRFNLESSELPLKFRNALYGWLEPEEVLLQVAFQPEIRARRLFFFERQVLPPLLAALTDRELLLITEEPPVANDRLGEYSEIYTYCPLSRIDSLDVHPHEEREQMASLRLSLTNQRANLIINSMISASCAPQFGRLCTDVTGFLVRRSAKDSPAIINNRTQNLEGGE